jgi:hypothetical protein
VVSLSQCITKGSTFINADANITIEDSGRGDVTLFNQGGMIKLDRSGNVELIGSDILTLDGQVVIFDSNVAYDIESSQTVRIIRTPINLKITITLLT